MESNRRQTGRRAASYGKSYYIEGSSVRKTAPSPYRRQPEGTRAARGAAVRSSRNFAAEGNKKAAARPGYAAPIHRSAEQHIADKRRQVNQRIAMRNREKALKLDLKYTVFLGISVIFVLISCVLYLNLQNQMTQKNNEIASLKSELNTLTDANIAARERINDAVDLDYVYQYATEKLGMIQPNAGQIVKYRSNDEDYVKQFQDIPQSSQ